MLMWSTPTRKCRPLLEVTTILCSRKRSASVQSYTVSDSDGVEVVSDSMQVKRLRKVRPASPEYRAMSPVTITDQSAVLYTSRELSFDAADQEGQEYFVVDKPSAIDETSSPKRVRRPTEKSLYMSRDKSRKVVVSQEKRVESRSQDTMPQDSLCRPRSGHAPVDILDPNDLSAALRHPSTSPTEAKKRPVVVKTEPLEDDAVFRSPSKSAAKADQSTRFSSPILVSSEEDEAPTPKVSPSKTGSKSRSKAMTECQHPRNDVLPSSTRHPSDDFTNSSDELPASIISPPSKSKHPAQPSQKPASVMQPSVVPSPSPSKSKISGPSLKEITAATQSSASSSASTVYLEDLVPAVRKPSFTLVPFDIANGPSGCPSHLLHTNDDGATSPIELLAGAFDLFEGAALQSISSALLFKEMRPFVNVTAALRQQVYPERFKHHVMWQGLNRSVIFTMLGSVQCCNLVHPTTIGQHLCKAISIIPFGDAWRRFQVFLGELYGKGQMRGPFEYGCLLTLSGRREGYFSGDVSSMVKPATPKKNARAFGGSGSTPTSSEWFDNKMPNCVDYDKPVPIYDASHKPFLFGRDDFIVMPSLPLYAKEGSIVDLLVDSLVSVFFAMSSYPKRNGGSSVPVGSSASVNDVLSLNIHSVIYYGVIPRDG